MSLKVLDAYSQSVQLDDEQENMLLSAMTGDADPRISACVECASAVVATEPFSNLVDGLKVLNPVHSDVIDELVDLVENADSVHLYIWQENDCVHSLWKDPLASEWTGVTGEKRLRR